jgi:hypothetical protein
MTISDEISRARAIAGNILLLIPGLGLVLTSTLKFFGVPAVVHRMALAGVTGEKLMIAAALELLSAISFIASMLLTIRFIRTCCNCRRSPAI